MMNYSLDQLTYRLYDGPADLAPLRVLATQAFEWQGWRVIAFVLGASHALRFERDDIVLTELLTCAPPETGLHLPRISLETDATASKWASGATVCLLERSRVAEQSDPLCMKWNSLALRCRLTAFTLCEGDALQGAFSSNCQLDAAYPILTSGDVPRTRIGWRGESDGRLTIETVHTYPEEGRGIRTESIYLWASEKDSKIGRATRHLIRDERALPLHRK